LVEIHTKLDPLMTELLNGLKNEGDIKIIFLQTLTKLLEVGGSKVTEATLSNGKNALLPYLKDPSGISIFFWI